MPTQNVNLSEQQADFIKSTISRGSFRNASEVVRAGLRLLEREEVEHQTKLERFREMVNEGFASLDRDPGLTISNEQELDAFMESVRADTRKKR